VLAEMARLHAMLNRHKLDVDYTVITAAYNGRMGRRTVAVGQLVNAGETLAFIVNNETDKWVVANFKETQVAQMQTGDSVKMIVDAYPDREFAGTIISFSPATGSRFSLLPPDNATGNFVKIVQRIPVRIRIDEKREDIEMLKAGMNVNVYVPKKQRHG
jgi:membrane fusion protein (multidrug efflux system)